jgi:hypothetical protein
LLPACFMDVLWLKVPHTALFKLSINTKLNEEHSFMRSGCYCKYSGVWYICSS